MLKLPNNLTNAIMLGGSFNPPTIAHLAMVEYLLKNTDKEIWIVPNGDLYHRKSLAPFPQRVTMLKLMFGNSERVKILEIENQGIFQGTYQTLRKLKHPLFVLGADSLKDLPTWINFPNFAGKPLYRFYAREFNQKEDLLRVSTVILTGKNREHFYLVDQTILMFPRPLQNFNHHCHTGSFQYIIKQNLYLKE